MARARAISSSWILKSRPPFSSRQRLRLARVSPVILQAYREDKIGLDCVMAFAVPTITNTRRLSGKPSRHGPRTAPLRYVEVKARCEGGSAESHCEVCLHDSVALFYLTIAKPLYGLTPVRACPVPEACNAAAPGDCIEIVRRVISCLPDRSARNKMPVGGG